MKTAIDIHTHTLVSGHAYGTIREMAAAAAEKKIEVLGFAEHAPGIPGTCDPFYYLNLQVIPRRISGVEIVHGCEVNIQNDGTCSLEERYMRCLDYAIIGIHSACYTDAGRENNTDNAIACMQHEKVHFMSHPDDDHTPLNYERLVWAAGEYHVALEVNNSSLIKKEARMNCYENYHTMLAFCKKYQVPVYIGSDAHDPSAVGEFQLAEALLEQESFPEELVLSMEKDRFYRWIGMTGKSSVNGQSD